MERQSTKLRALLRAKTFLHMPSVYNRDRRPPRRVAWLRGDLYRWLRHGRIDRDHRAAADDERADRSRAPYRAEHQHSAAGRCGLGLGEPIHTMRTMREFIRAGVAGIHLEDALYPKRAHYHNYVVHGVPVEEFVEKVEYSCKERDRSDPDFVIIARTDTCRALGLEEASMRLNRAADVGADLGLLFPRTPQEAEDAVKKCRLPLIYVQSRGNRDGRPIISRKDLQQMGYVGCIEAQVTLCTEFHFLKKALTELARPATTPA